MVGRSRRGREAGRATGTYMGRGTYRRKTTRAAGDHLYEQAEACDLADAAPGRHGLTIDHLLAVEVVTAEGRTRFRLQLLMRESQGVSRAGASGAVTKLRITPRAQAPLDGRGVCVRLRSAWFWGFDVLGLVEALLP